jgi:hypothetical protein
VVHLRRRDAPVQLGQALLEVQRGEHRAGVHPELHHGEGDVGLDADDHRHRPPQPGHLRDVAQRPGPERVQDVERGHVDDHAAGPVGPDPVDQVLLEAHQLRVVQRGVHRGDQVRTLPQDREQPGDGGHGPPAPSLRATE